MRARRECANAAYGGVPHRACHAPWRGARLRGSTGSMASWTIAIDAGTSFTTAAVASAGGAPELLEIEQSRYLPSVVVLAEDGTPDTGRAAASLAAMLPDRAERLPKRALVNSDRVRLGD